MAIDLGKEVDVFDNIILSSHPVYAIGCGSTASVVLPTLVRMGCNKFILWDKDVVSAHNIANQAFDEAMIGMPKVKAMTILLKRINKDVKIIAHNEWWSPEADPKGVRGIVMSLADKMEVRREIIQEVQIWAKKVGIYIDTRTGLFTCQCYSSLPEDKLRMDYIYNNTLFTDEEVEEQQRANNELSACGMAQSVFPTVQAAGMLTAARILEWVKDAHISAYSVINILDGTAFKMPCR